VIGRVPVAAAADIDAAVAAARRAFDETDWPSRPAAERAELMEALAAKLYERREEFRDLLVDELGCPVTQAEVYQAVAPSLHWNYYADMARHYPFNELRTNDLGVYAGGAGGGMIMPFKTQSLVMRRPAGVVAAITAYNFPLAGTAQKIAPAIAAGCTVVVKVPDPDPLAIFAMGDLLNEVGFPPGVVNIVATDAAGSEHLVSHQGVDMVSFTGSSAVGAKIGAACGARVRPVVLELGGKSAAVVLPDADFDAAVPALMGASFIPSSGQNCTCHGRFIVPRERQDELVGRLVEALGQVKLGDPHDRDTDMGPLISKAHRDRVLTMIDDAVAAGAKVAFGGGSPARPDQGWYVQPTLLTNVTSDMAIAQDEVFGPVVAVLAYDTEDEAIRIANDTRYGLAGSVYTADPAHGFEVAQKIRVGTFSINAFAADFNSPFGGFKQSGVGREHGVAGLEQYLLPQTVSVDPTTTLPDNAVRAAQKVTRGFDWN